jgi:hypothetical protein
MGHELFGIIWPKILPGVGNTDLGERRMCVDWPWAGADLAAAWLHDEA